jgi:hypothetical protein
MRRLSRYRLFALEQQREPLLEGKALRGIGRHLLGSRRSPCRELQSFSVSSVGWMSMSHRLLHQWWWFRSVVVESRK